MSGHRLQNTEKEGNAPDLELPRLVVGSWRPWVIFNSIWWTSKKQLASGWHPPLSANSTLIGYRARLFRADM